jgi:hypothetical protein
MNFTKTMFALAIGSVGIMGAMSAHAVNLVNGDQLTISPGVKAKDANGNVTSVTGSWFGMDQDGNGKFANSEKTILKPGTTGIIIGQTTTAGASHSGPITAGDTNAIDKPWGFFGNTGSDFLTSPVTGDTTTGLDFSGWRVTWNGIPSINMGGGLQNCGTASDGICVKGTVDTAGTYDNGTGIASFAWDGTYGHAYTLDYNATVPQADPSGFAGVSYHLHLEGTVMAVPEASTYGMMLAGLGLVGFAVRRRKLAYNKLV